MATGKASDFQIYHEQYYGGMFEELAQNVNAFNSASRNGIRLVTKRLKGYYEQESFFDRISTLITRRDTTSVSTATDIAMTQDQLINVKVNRKIGPVAQTLDAWKKIGKDQEEMSYILGKMVAKEKMHDMLETAIRAVEAAISGQSALVYDASGQSTGTLTVTHLISGENKLGDQASRLVCWVMHSKCWNDLRKQAVSDKIYEEAGRVVYGGDPGTLNKPVIVTDCDALYVGADSSYATYQVLGLVDNAVVVTESEEETITTDLVTGLENLVYRLQGEYAYNIGIKGFQWDTSNGGANPTNNNIGLATNWDKVYADVKNCAGIRIITD